MKRKSIASVVMEFFETTQATKGTVKDILKFYINNYAKDNNVELKNAQHAIYLKANRLVKSGELKVISKKGNAAVFALVKTTSTTDKTLIETSDVIAPSEKKLLLKRESELEYELEVCIAEAKGYEELKSILPGRSSLLTNQKEEAKKRAIHINGLLVSTQNTLRALS